MRDIPGFLETRRKILEGKASIKASWIGYIVANYTAKEYAAAAEILKKLRETLDRGDPYEESELVLFHALCLEKSHAYAEAVTFLQQNKAYVVDILGYKTKLAQLLVLSGQFDEGKVAWEALVYDQPENYRYHTGLQLSLLQLDAEKSQEMFDQRRLELPCTVLRLTSEQKQMLFKWYSTQSKVTKSRAFDRVKLVLLYDDGHNDAQQAAFKAALDKYIRRCLQDAIPSLCQDIVALVMVQDPINPDRVIYAKDAVDFAASKIIQLALSIIEDVLRTDRQQLLPSTELWAMYLKAHLQEKSGQISAALETIDAAILHTPTALDMYTKKAKILRKNGDYEQSAKITEEVRRLDLQDRYLNNKATKYFLRNDQIDQGMETIALFTKHEGDPQKTLYDLQCSWYELELAESYARKKCWALALKKFYCVKQHFEDQYDDLFDFHGYCVRRVSPLKHTDGEGRWGQCCPHLTSLYVTSPLVLTDSY